MEVTYFVGIDGLEPRSMIETKNLLLGCIKDEVKIRQCLKPKENLGVFFERYIRYPVYARRYISEFNHILDQTNSGVMAFSKGEKFIVTVNDIYPVAHPIPGASFYLHCSIPFLKKADHVIAISKFTKNELLKYSIVDEDKISVIYYAVDDIFKPNKKIRIQSDCKIILYVGSNEPRKNLHTLLRAFSKLQRTNSNSILILVVDLSSTNIIQQSVNHLHLSKNVMILSDLTKKSLQYLYNQADLFVFPSHYEGFGLPLLEAMTCGLPVIAYRCSSMPEVCGDAAIMLNPASIFNHSILSECMTKVLTDPRLSARMSRRSLKQAKNFSKGKYKRETLSVYNEVFV